MKKNVIAVILSIVMAVGSIGTAVPAFAAEDGTTAEATSEVEETETSDENVNEEPETTAESDNTKDEQTSDDDDATQSDAEQNSANDNSTTETPLDSEETTESDEEQPDDEEDASVIDEAEPANDVDLYDYWADYDYEPEKVEFNGNYYYFRNCGMKNSYGFDQAEAWCEQEGGHLVTINSPEEEAFIRSEIKKINVLYGFWIGAYRENTSDSWKWINGEEWNYPGTNGSGTSNWPSNALWIVYYKDATEADVKDADVLMINCYGLLSSIYHYGDVAYVGGGFGVGIHNLLEAAVWDVPVFFGPNNHKFQEAQALKQNGGFEIHDYEEFERQMNRFASDAQYLKEQGQLAGQFVKGQAGATAKVLGSVTLP